MKNKIKKYAVYAPYIVGGLFLLYLIPYGAIDRTQAFGKWLNGGMSPSEVRYMACIGKQSEERKPYCEVVMKSYEGIK